MSSNNTLEKSSSSNQSGTYTNTATTFTVIGGSKPSEYNVYYGSIDSSNIAHYAALIRVKDDNNSVPNKCAEQGTLTRQ
jgi:hypothetical protein